MYERFYCSTYVILYESTNRNTYSIHKSFEGTISFYCDESDSPYTHIVIALANRPDKTERFVVTEDTIFADDSESIIAERIVGVHVEIESEYWNNVEYDYYPVTLISGCL